MSDASNQIAGFLSWYGKGESALRQGEDKGDRVMVIGSGSGQVEPFLENIWKYPGGISIEDLEQSVRKGVKRAAKTFFAGMKNYLKERPWA